MKNLILVIASMLLLASCGKQASNQPAQETTVKKVKITEILTKEELAKIDATINSGAERGSRKKIAEIVTLDAGDPVLTNNGGGSFSIDYGDRSDVVWHFFRGGDTLSTSGNVIPQNSMSFYLNPVTTWASTFTRLNYQSVVAFGSTEPDANGVVGGDWVFRYSNPVQ